MIVFIAIVFASVANGFAISSPMGRVVLSRGYVSRSRNRWAEEEALKKTKELRLKCNYVNERFPFTKETSSLPPPTNFKNIYTVDQAKELWDFQQKNCIPIEISPWEQIFALSMLCLFITLLIIATCHRESYYGGEI
jgi:hypothetical protein